MAEDMGLCTYVRHHQQKLVLFLASMRSHRDALRDAGHSLAYRELDEGSSYEEKLEAHLDTCGATTLHSWEVEDRFFEARLRALAERRGIDLVLHPSPMFLTSRARFADFVERTGKKKNGEPKPLRMASFYMEQRRRLGLLMEDGKPVGGQWSFDADNREKIPKNLEIPELRAAALTPHVRDVISLVRSRFGSHPGRLDEGSWWMPTTREQALGWMNDFLDARLQGFGPYEDALTTRPHPFLWHSALSPLLNIGLLTPSELLEATMARADDEAGEDAVPINSLEGFVRQVIGWREFVRGVYQTRGEEEERANFFGHHRSLKACWWSGQTGIPPLDDAIQKANGYGWAHHIERLMVVGNLMLLCEVEPREAYRWFMEMFVDSSDWVMVPNVYGMALFSDGGVFATKPYISGSNYIFKMSDYPKPKKKDTPPSYLEDGMSWADVWDGLYWRFIAKNEAYFRSQPRLSRVVGNLDRMKEERRARIFDAAERFLAFATEAPRPR